MQQTEGGDQRLQVRGKLDPESPIYATCKDSNLSLFRTIKTLAEEAIAVRAKLAASAETEHPLQKSLSKMTSAEAVTFLLGVTQLYRQTQHGALSDIPWEVLSDRVREMPRQSERVTAKPGSLSLEPALTSDDDGWANDMDEAMDVLSGIPEFAPSN